MTSRALEGFCAALLPPEAGGPAPRELAQRLEGYLARFPAPTRAAVRAGFSSYDGLALATTGHRLAELDEVRRDRVLQRASRGRAARLGFDAMKAIVLLAAGSGRYAPQMRASAGASPPARPDADLPVTAAVDWPDRSRVDVLVVGSGAGGAMAARTLARAGLDTLVVEEGRRHTVEEFRSGDPLDRFADLYRDAGTTGAAGWPPVVLPIGRGVGGTTLVNSGTCYRTPPAVQARWRDAHGLGLADERFPTYLDEVERTLRVAPVPDPVMGRNGQLVLAGAAALGWAAGPLRRNAPGCGGCCQCAIGCPRNAKFGVHLNALPEAVAAGARILSEGRVMRIVVWGGRARGVQVRRRDGSVLQVDAERVVVAAGATESPPLLRRSGLGGHPRVGRNLSVHPAVGVAGRFSERVVPWRGVLQSAAVEEFHDSRGILVEATSTPPGMGSMVLPGHGRELLSQLDDADHLVTLGAMVADRPGGRVLGARRTAITYRMATCDGARLLESVEIMGRLLFAAGATEVLTGLPRDPVVRSLGHLGDAVRSARVADLHVAAFHPTGSLAAGGDPERHPVDADGRLRGVEGVWVADGGLPPSCPTVNPQVSIMALALAVGERAAAG